MSWCGSCWGCCEYNFPGNGQPISTSGPAIDAAECATIGTADTVNALISSGLAATQAVVAAKNAVAPPTPVKAKPLTSAASSTSKLLLWGIGLLLVGFLFFRMK